MVDKLAKIEIKVIDGPELVPQKLSINAHGMENKESKRRA